MAPIERPTDSVLKQMLLAGEVDDAALPAGSKVGRYVVLEKLGFGGMSIVYKAYDPQLDRAIALKLMRVGAAAAASERLLREAQALAKLSHPNIVAVHDVGVVGDEVFVAMEFVAGVTLTEWCRGKGRTLDEVLEAFRGAGRGLAAAHAAGLVHRDFKPDNVIVGGDARPRVLDFGLARAAGATEAGLPSGPRAFHVTSSGALAGTPAYMAPEQHLGGDVDGRSDQFAFCVALWEAVYRHPPFVARTVEEMADAVTHGRVAEPPADARAPGWLRPVLLRGLSVAPADRHPTMDALLEALARDPRARRRRAIAIAVGGLAAVALVVGLGLALVRADRSRACDGAEGRLAGVWDGPVKARVQRAFDASGRPHATETFARVVRVLDGQAAEWAAMQRESCEAARAGHQGKTATALRAHCLDERRTEMRQLTTKLARGGARTVDGAVHAAFELTSVAACGDVAALALASPHEQSAATAASAEACGVPEGGGRYYPLEIGRVWVYDVIDKSTRRSRGDPKVVTVEALAPIGGCKDEIVAYRLRQQEAEGYAFRWQEVVRVDGPAGQPPGWVTVRHRDQWFEPDGTVTKDEYFVPSRIRLDESCAHSVLGATYLDAYDEVEVAPGGACGEEVARQTRTFDWKVVGVDVPVRLDLDYTPAACCPPDAPRCGPPPDGPGHSCTQSGERRWSCTFRTLQVDRREVSGGTAGTYWFAVDVGKVLEDDKGENREELMCFRR